MDLSQVKIAVVGAGYWGKNLVRNFAHLGVLGGVCDADTNLCQQRADQYNVPSYTWQQLLKDSSIAAVVIAVPAQLHAKLALEALAAGKHVFVEKPLALTMQDAEAVVAMAREQQRVLMVGHLLQYHPIFVELKRLVGRGDLGKIQYLYSHRLNLGKFRCNEDILWSFAPHDISMILSLIADAEITDINVNAGYYLNQNVADISTTHITFSNNTKAHVFVSWLHPYKEQRLVVVGDKGMAVFDDSNTWDQKLLIYPHHIEWHEGMPIPDKKDAMTVTVPESEPLRNECQHFIDCIIQNKHPLTDGEEGLRVLDVLTQATRQLKKQSKTVHANANCFVHESSYVDDGAFIGDGTKIWHFSHILGNTKLGKSCVVGQNVMIGPDVVVGDSCKIQNNVSIYKGVELEEGVFCGPSCVFTNVKNPRATIERKDEFKKTLVKKHATIGANATIVCGVILGEYCFIGAGAVVTKDVPAYALMVGNPARQVGWMSDVGEILCEDLTCPRSGKEYVVKNKQLVQV